MTDTYMDVLDELRDLTLKKRAGYSPGADPYKNFRMTEMFSLPCEDCGHPTPIPAIFGIMIREMDKMARIASLLAKPSNEQVGETLRETMMDAGNYPLIGVAYTDNEQQEKQSFANVGELLADLFPAAWSEGMPPITVFDTPPSSDEVLVFDSSDMEPPEDVDVPRDDEDMRVIECCPPNCDECVGECRPTSTDCDPDCEGCIAQMVNKRDSMFAKQDNAKSKNHDEATCPVCNMLRGTSLEVSL